MVERGDGTNDGPRSDGGNEGKGNGRPGYRWLDDPRLQRERLEIQVKIILDSIPGAAVYPPDRPGEMEFLYIEGRILFRDADLARIREMLPGDVVHADDGQEPSPGRRVDERLTTYDGLTVYAPEGLTTIQALERIDAQLGVGVATPEHILYVTPASSCCPADEPTPIIGADPWPGVWCRGEGDGRGAVVAVIDSGLISGLTTVHPWLQGVTGDEEDFHANDIGPYVGHGTFVAGVLRTMAPAAEVHVHGILTDGGAVTETRIVDGLYAALDDMPDIISMSAGCTTRHNLPPLAFEVFWERRLRQLKGTVLVVAAGNNASRQAFWPAAFPWTVSVGALTQTVERAPFSDFGSWVDVYALGVDMVNAYPNGTLHYKEPPRIGQTAEFTAAMAVWSGTSFSTPLVAGMIAARLSRTGQSGEHAARSVLRIARQHSVAGIGAIAEPQVIVLPDPNGP